MTQQEESFNCTAFFEGMATRIAEFKKDRESRNEIEAFDFTASALFRPKETTFSRILAFFLNPNGSHGQKDRFLRVFCEEVLGWSEGQTTIRLRRPVKVTTEHATHFLDEETNQRRIDLTVEFGKSLIIGIECKIWASDQPNQVHDYCLHMKQGPWADYLCIYLTPYGGVPGEESITTVRRNDLGERFLAASWCKDIYGLLDHFASVCKADPVTAFIRDFQKYIQYTFKKERDMDIKKHIADHLIQHPEHVETALSVHANINELRKRLWERVRVDLEGSFSREQSSRANMPASQAIKEWRIQEWNSGQWVNAQYVPVTIQHDHWKWYLYFDSGRCHNMVFAISFQEGPWNIDMLKKVQEQLPQYQSLDEARKKIYGPTPCYRQWLDTEESIETWRAMNQAVEVISSHGNIEISAFSKQIIDWYMEARNAVSVVAEKQDP